MLVDFRPRPPKAIPPPAPNNVRVKPSLNPKAELPIQPAPLSNLRLALPRPPASLDRQPVPAPAGSRPRQLQSHGEGAGCPNHAAGVGCWDDGPGLC
jgi:hypothetical protein